MMYFWLTIQQVCYCANCLPGVITKLVRPMCADAKLMSRDVDESLAPPYAEYMAVAQDSVHIQAIRVRFSHQVFPSLTR
jgi:hypothetical protein